MARSWGWGLTLYAAVPDGGSQDLPIPGYDPAIADTAGAQASIHNQLLSRDDVDVAIRTDEAIATITNHSGVEWPLNDYLYLYVPKGDVGPDIPDVLTFFNLDNPPFYFTKPNKITVPLSFNKGTRAWGYVQSRVYCRDHDGNNVTIPDFSLSWSTTNAAVATSTDEDSPNAVIELRGVGVATVTCRNDTFKSEWSCEFTVSGPAPNQYSDIILDMSDGSTAYVGTMLVGQSYTAEMRNRDTRNLYIQTGQPITWTSSDPTVATVTEGATDEVAVILGVGPGRSTIRAQTDAGSYSHFNIDVVEAAQAPAPATVATILVDPTDPIRMLAGDGVLMGMHFGDGSGNDAVRPGDIVWTTTDEMVATITPSGPPDFDAVTVTAIQTGVATITGTVADPPLSATIEIDIIEPKEASPPVDTTSATSILLKLPDNSPNTFVAGSAPVTVTAEYRRGDAAAPPPSSDFSWMLEDKVGNSIVFTFGSGTQTSVVLTPTAGGRQTLVHRCPRDGSGLIAEIQVICTDAPGLEQQPGTPPAEAAPKKI